MFVLLHHVLISYYTVKRKLINEYKIQPYNEDKRTGVLRHIILRQSFAFGEFMVMIVSKTNFIPRIKEIVEKITKKFPEVVSVYQNINYEKTNVILGNKNFKLFGRDTIKEKIGINMLIPIPPKIPLKKPSAVKVSTSNL